MKTDIRRYPSFTILDSKLALKHFQHYQSPKYIPAVNLLFHSKPFILVVGNIRRAHLGCKSWPPRPLGHRPRALDGIHGYRLFPSFGWNFGEAAINARMSVWKSLVLGLYQWCSGPAEP